MSTYSAGSASLTIVPDARQFREKLEADLRNVRAEYAVQITADLARARADIDKFRAEQEAKAVHLRAEVDRNHLKKSMEGAKGDFENLASVLGEAGKIRLAVVGIDLLPSLATGLVAVTQAMEQLAEGALALPGILAGVGASVGTLLLGLGGVKEAWTAIDKVASESGADQARLAEQATAATNTLRNAKADEAKAQKDVAQAYEDARNQLEDLNIQQRGGVLSEKEAILGAAKARRDLATGRHKDALDEQEAQLRVEEADQRVVEARQHNIEIQQKVSEQNAKGIEGSDRVVAANERLTRSHEAVQQAQASVANLGAGGAGDKAAEAMAKLAPNARQFVQTMLDLKPAFMDLRNTDAQNLFEGLGAALKTLAARDLPNLKTGIGGIATAMNRDFKQLFGSLGSDSTRGLIDRILGNTANSNQRVKAAIDPMVRAIGTLTAASSDTLPRLADAVGAVADRFDQFISAADKDGRLSKWINDGETAFTHLGDIVLNIGEMFHGLNTALGGKGLLASLDDVTEHFKALINSTDGQQKLAKFFQEGREEFAKWKPVIEDLAKLLPPMFQAAHQAADEYLPVIKSITDFMAKHPELVKQAVDAYLLWKTVLEPIGAVTKAIGGASEAVKALITYVNGVGPAATKTAATVQAASAAEAAAQEQVGVSALEAEAAMGAGGASRLGKLGQFLGKAGPIGILGIGAYLAGEQLDQYQAQHPGDPNNPITQQLQGNPGYQQFLQSQQGNGGQPSPSPNPAPHPAPAAPGTLPNATDWKRLADQGDPMAKWVMAGKDPEDQAKRAAWLDAHDSDRNAPFTPPASYDSGGPTHNSGGGQLAVVHPKEYVANATGRSTLGDSFLAEANQGHINLGLLPHFDDGGPGDKFLSGVQQGVGGPIGSMIGMFSGSGSRGGGGPIPGIWGLMGAGSDPNAQQAWGGQTANWFGNFASKNLMSAGTTLLQGGLGLVGLENSILSPNNAWNQAAQNTAGFFLGDKSPFRSTMGSPADLSGADIGSATIPVGGGSIQIPTYKTAQGPAGSSPSGMVNSDGSLSPAAQHAIQYAQAHALGQKYVYGGIGPTGYDCSGIASAIYAQAKGLPQNQRYFTTESDFAALGFQPGYARGDLNIGVMRGGGGPNSHMVLTLPNGINVESGGASDTTMYGGAAKGALDLPLHWHLALSGNQGVGAVPGLYDDGGPLPTGLSLAMNKTGQQEQVYTAEQHAQAQRALQAIGNAQQVTPASPQIPDAQQMRPPAQPAPPPPPQPTPEPPPAAPAQPGGPISPAPLLAPQALAGAPSSQDHNLKVVDTAIASGAEAIGNAAAAAMSVGGMGGGAGGQFIAGLAKQGGKIATNAANVVSSFLVGNVTPGTNANAYGAPLRPPQISPNVAAAPNVQWNISGNYELRSAMEQAELKQAQEAQTYLAHHGRISG